MSAVDPVVITLAGSPHRARTLEWGLAEGQIRRAEAGLREVPHPEVAVDLRDDDPPRAPADAARDGQLLVVGSRGLGTLRGSVSSAVLRVADGTVVVVHRGPAREATQDDVAPGSSTVA